jgi:hypothetical protein
VIINLQRPCGSEAPSTAPATPGDHEQLIGGAPWRSKGDLCLGQSVTWSFYGWMYHQGTVRFCVFFAGVAKLMELMVIGELNLFATVGNQN